MFSVRNGPFSPDTIGFVMTLVRCVSVLFRNERTSTNAMKDVECLRGLYPGKSNSELFEIIKLNSSMVPTLYDVVESEYLENCRTHLGLAGSQ